MVRSNQSAPSLRDLYSAVFRHKRKALAFFLLVMATVMVVTLLSPKTYRSEGTFLVRLGRENMTLDPTATIGQEPTISVPYSRENEINSVSEVLQSRALIEKAVETVGPAAILGKSDPKSESSSSKTKGFSFSAVTRPIRAVLAAGKRCVGYLNPLSSPPVSDRDRAVIQVTKSLKVWPVRRSSIIQLSYDGASPKLSQAVLASMIDSYLDHHARINRPAGTHEFLAKQTDRLRIKLTDLEDELREMKSNTGLVSPEYQRKLLVERIGRLKDELTAAATAAASSEAGVDVIREKLNGMTPIQVNSEVAGVTNEGTDGMREQLYALEILEEEASAKYTEEHPKMLEIRRQVAAAEAMLAKEKPTRTHVTSGPNKVYEQGQLTLLSQEPVLSSLRAKVGVLRNQLADAHLSLTTLNRNELRIAKLQREVQIHETNYRRYCVNLEQARIDEALQQARMSNVEVVQPATCDVRAVSPKKRLNLALGLFVGLFGAIGLALLMEYRDHSLRSPEDVEKNLDLPTLVSIPRLRRRQLILNGRR